MRGRPSGYRLAFGGRRQITLSVFFISLGSFSPVLRLSRGGRRNIWPTQRKRLALIHAMMLNEVVVTVASSCLLFPDAQICLRVPALTFAIAVH